MAGKGKHIFELNQDVEMLIVGYIRNCQTLLRTDSIIPEPLLFMIVEFYFIDEYFAIIPKEMITLSEDKHTIIRTGGTSSWNCTSYLNIEIDSMVQHTYKWYIQINHCVHSHIFIGISGNKTDPNKALFEDYDYVYWSANGQMLNAAQMWAEYGESYKDGDEIGVILNLKNKELSFEKNGKSQGISSSNVRCGTDIKYRLAIALYAAGSSCTLRKFQRIVVNEN
eukprot:608217_1